jgi:hypothetical protein
MNESFTFPEPIILQADQYATISLAGSTSSLLDAGKPILPVVTKVFTFPFGSRIVSVDVNFSGIKEQLLIKKVQPGSRPVTSIVGMQVDSEPIKDKTIYDSPELYPSSNCSYTITTGLYNEEHIIFLAVQCYPIRYSPAQNTIYYSKTFDIDIIYEEPSNPITFQDEYD